VAAPALPADVRRLREQLVRDQAPSARQRSEYFDVSRFSSRHPYSARRIPINTLLEMRVDAILRFAQLVALVSIFTAKWRIESPSARKAAFVDHALRRIIGRLIVQFYESWNMGWQALVKEFGLMDPGWQFIDREARGGPAAKPVWDGGPQVPALVWEPFVPLHPKIVTPVWTEGGSFNGIALSGSGGYFFPTVDVAASDIIENPLAGPYSSQNDQQQKKVDVGHSLWVVNERDSEFGSIWGRSRLSYAYKYWWSAEMTLGILNRSVERKGDPTIVSLYPQGSSTVDGQEINNQQIAQQIGQMARSGAVLTVPSEVWGEDSGTSNQSPKWKVFPLETAENFDKLRGVLDYLDTMKFRAMAVSELALAEGSGGTSSRNVAATTGERTHEAQIFTQVEWDEIINRYMIPQLADANFPELRDVPARKVTQAFGEDEAALAADILRSFANADPTQLPLNLPALLERFQIDSLDGKQLADWEKRMADQAEQKTQPPPAPARPGGPAGQPVAGTTDTGFYYDAPERIELEDEALLSALPKTKHYSDRAVLAQTRLVRRLWHDYLTAAYEDFATRVADADLSEAALAVPKPTEAARAIVAGWRVSNEVTAKVVKATAAALTRILSRAGALELSSSRMATETFDPSAERVGDWVTENVGALVRHVDKTTRDQLRTFLAAQLEQGVAADQIAKNMRSHFEGFPAWRADMIARTEGMRFYNAGTLFAADAAGAQVQALDAQKGPTDKMCEDRHGRIYPIVDAWRESVRVHPRDTLAFRIVPLGVSFVHRPAQEMGEVAAQVDQERRVVYLVEGLDQATESRFLKIAVDWLVASG
jgi:hypothetical protein